MGRGHASKKGPKAHGVSPSLSTQQCRQRLAERTEFILRSERGWVTRAEECCSCRIFGGNVVDHAACEMIIWPRSNNGGPPLLFLLGRLLFAEFTRGMPVSLVFPVTSLPTLPRSGGLPVTVPASTQLSTQKARREHHHHCPSACQPTQPYP